MTNEIVVVQVVNKTTVQEQSNDISAIQNLNLSEVKQDVNKSEVVDGEVSYDGWTATLGVVPDGARRVLKVVDWFGGEGIKPQINVYLGLTGYVADIADATDIIGPPGAPGLDGQDGQDGLDGDKGDKGDQGDPGEGVPTGGTTGQVLVKNSGTDFDTSWQNQTGGGAVDSVNGQTGVVDLGADDISDSTTTHKFTNQTDIDRLADTSGLNTGDQIADGITIIGAGSIADPFKYNEFTVQQTSDIFITDADKYKVFVTKGVDFIADLTGIATDGFVCRFLIDAKAPAKITLLHSAINIGTEMFTTLIESNLGASGVTVRMFSGWIDCENISGKWKGA